MNLVFQAMTEASARQILAWRYAPPYDLYNANPANLDEDIAYFVDPPNQYYEVLAETGAVVAFRCFGVDAQVPGGDYSTDALDTGGGMRPDLTGKGLGLTVIRAGLEFGQRVYQPRAFRVTVAEFNERALKTCERAGYRRVNTFFSERNGKNFVILLRHS